MRQLVTTRTVARISPIPNADAIEVAEVDGWKVVVKKGDFLPGQEAIYFEIDSFLPSSDQRFSFLSKTGVRTQNNQEGYRLRTVKLRGQVSQGLLLPVKDFPEFKSIREDTDLAALINVQKWDPPLPSSLSGKAKGNFPSFLGKTDQERAQNIPRQIFGYDTLTVPFPYDVPPDAWASLEADGTIFLDKDDNTWKKVIFPEADPKAQYEVTIKLDGSSCTFYHNNGKTGVCSRNLELDPEDTSSTFVQTYQSLDMPNLLPRLGRNIALQGELMGPGIQKNREGLSHPTFFVFDIFDIDTQSYLPPDERRRLLADVPSLQHVPVVQRATTLQELGIHNMADLLAFADGPSLNNKTREGLVFKRLDGQFSFKVISNAFLQKEDN